MANTACLSMDNKQTSCNIHILSVLIYGMCKIDENLSLLHARLFITLFYGILPLFQLCLSAFKFLVAVVWALYSMVLGLMLVIV